MQKVCVYMCLCVSVCVSVCVSMCLCVCQSSARSVTAGLEVREDLPCTNGRPLTQQSNLNLSWRNLLFVLIITVALDSQESSNDTNFYLRDQSLFMNSMAPYNVNTVNDG